MEQAEEKSHTSMAIQGRGQQLTPVLTPAGELAAQPGQCGFGLHWLLDSQDITPLNFVLLGFVKTKVFKAQVSTNLK